MLAAPLVRVCWRFWLGFVVGVIFRLRRTVYALSILRIKFYALHVTMLIIHLTRSPLLVVLFTLVHWSLLSSRLRVLAHDLAVGRFSVLLLTYILPHVHAYLPQSEIVFYIVTL